MYVYIYTYIYIYYFTVDMKMKHDDTTAETEIVVRSRRIDPHYLAVLVSIALSGYHFPLHPA
jgi:hypothetical protein